MGAFQHKSISIMFMLKPYKILPKVIGLNFPDVHPSMFFQKFSKDFFNYRKVEGITR